MATKKIPELPALENTVDADSFLVHNTTTAKTNRMSWASIKARLGALFIASNTAITAGTKTKISYDAKGLITTGADATTADIADSSNKRYCTDAQKTVIGNTSGTNTGDETASRVAALQYGASTESSPDDTYSVPMCLSTLARRITIAQLKAFLKTYFDTLYSSGGILKNQSVADQSIGASDVYLGGSSIDIGAVGGWQIGTQYRCRFYLSKTAAGTAGFTIAVRIGTAGSISDSDRASIAFTAGSAAADRGVFDVLVTFRTVGSGTSAVISVVGECQHQLAATGLTTQGTGGAAFVPYTTAGFDSSASDKIGISVIGGSSFSGTCTLVQAELIL